MSHASGDDIGQLAGHGVFVDLRQIQTGGLFKLCVQGFLGAGAKGLVLLGVPQGLGEHGQVDSQGAHVVKFTGQCVADDYGAALSVKVFLLVA